MRLFFHELRNHIKVSMVNSAEEVWGIFKVITVKLQSLRRDFETMFMTKGESIADFLSRTMTIVSQMRTYGEKISEKL